jgi:hypothetical protein
MRIGMDNIAGYIDGVEGWAKEGGTLSKSDIVSMDDERELVVAACINSVKSAKTAGDFPVDERSCNCHVTNRNG